MADTNQDDTTTVAELRLIAQSRIDMLNRISTQFNRAPFDDGLMLTCRTGVYKQESLVLIFEDEIGNKMSFMTAILP